MKKTKRVGGITNSIKKFKKYFLRVCDAGTLFVEIEGQKRPVYLTGIDLKELTQVVNGKVTKCENQWSRLEVDTEDDPKTVFITILVGTRRGFCFLFEEFCELIKFHKALRGED